MIEFRKEYFADERDDNLNEIGKPTQRQDALGGLAGAGGVGAADGDPHDGLVADRDRSGLVERFGDRRKLR